ncbi:DUF4255 domain-containing protein [Paenibacillus spongiae]|uniref:DUF4255 domain-containing protein n=1 Tax=Paenibacillus spongiae TaxID=2909671 RepID=A0ABY5S0L9_9BACL|nr:DUF4255 domain-containing protein [Paenibacillus spongiae]UVI27376.1 DUF4255 domain-containing protein [Paenibacillus spongiae]
MSSKAISDVGDTLLQLLQTEMADLIPNPNHIVLHSPAGIVESNVRLSLFLYNLLENSYMRYQDSILPTDANYKLPPLILDLHYMLTAYSAAETLTERTMEEHQLLGRAMSVLHNHASLGGAELKGSLAGSDQDLRITLNPVSVPEISDIWTAFSDNNLRLSVCYVVSPLIILPDPLTVGPAKTVDTRVFKFAAPVQLLAQKDDDA